jgi:hypothetical protein
VIEHLFDYSVEMERLVVELPASGEWSDLAGHALDAKVRELDVASRRVEAAIVGAVDHADVARTTRSTATERSGRG